jgi:CxxC-x17-CxxC domain-containing protein
LEEELSVADRTLVCRDCGREFIFTAGEQDFYASKGLTNDPVRCSSCRSSRKSSGMGGGSGGGGFEGEDNGGYVRYGTFASFGGRTPRQMHPATCAECGQMTEVPFVPRGDRPVYCSACYNKIRAPRV